MVDLWRWSVRGFTVRGLRYVVCDCGMSLFFLCAPNLCVNGILALGATEEGGGGAYAVVDSRLSVCSALVY